MQSGIYKITHTESGRFYIGSAKNFKSRWNTHNQDLIKNKHHSRYLQAIYNKYGKDSIVYEVIENCEVNELITREQYYLDTLMPDLNMVKTAGNCLGHKHSEETKRKQSERQTGKKVKFSEQALANIREGIKNRIISDEGKKRMAESASKRMKGSKQKPETIAKVVAFHTGRKRSEETKLKISEGRKGKQVSAEGLAKMKAKMQSPEMREHLSKLAKLRPPPKGKPMSEEQKRKLSELKKGVPLSEEHKKKLKESRVNYKHSEETKNKLKQSKLKFNKEEVSEIRKLHSQGYSMKKLGEVYGVMRHTISRVVNGKNLYINY
jgi:group I intron endonuclease